MTKKFNPGVAVSFIVGITSDDMEHFAEVQERLEKLATVRHKRFIRLTVNQTIDVKAEPKVRHGSFDIETYINLDDLLAFLEQAQ